MTLRPLTSFEQLYADKVVQLGTDNNWEYAAYLAGCNGPLLELVTEELDNKAEPTPTVLDAIARGSHVVVHHNHLSQQSLSLADWNGAACLFSEIFAHCNDGTTYWGRAVRREAIKGMFDKGQFHTMQVMDMLCGELRNGVWHAHSTELGTFFVNEVINRAMALKKYVDYAYSWGHKANRSYAPLRCLSAPDGVLNRTIEDVAEMYSERI
jgi:hypothetical protein